MMKRIFLWFALLPVFAFAQTGNFFLTHYAHSQQHSNKVCFDMAQDTRGVMYFATNGGVLEFDGKNWDILKGQNQVYSLAINDGGEIYWGGSNAFGKVNVNAQGFQQLDVLKDSIQTDIVHILSTKDRIYFLSEVFLYIFNPADQKIEVIESSASDGGFTGVFELFGAVYVSSAANGIFKLAGGKLSPSKIAFTSDIVFCDRIDNNYVIATADNRLWVLSELLEPRAITIDEQKYLDASVIISGSWVNKQLVALGTLRGGVVFVNPITGHTQEIVNYGTGLPDNEVFALMPDRNQNVWIAHDYGFTRVSPYMPFRTFSHYTGLQGNSLCALSHDGTVYTGTSLGLFRLERENVYDELVYYVDVEVKPAKKQTPGKQPEVAATTTETSAEKTESQQGTKKRGVFGFLKKKNKTKEASTPETAANETQSTKTESKEQTQPAKPVYRREKRVEKVLRSSQYAYKKVNGVDAKITHLLELDGKLLASGLGGIYQVEGLQSKVIHDEPIRFLHATDKALFASTYDDRVIVLKAGTTNWNIVNTLNNLETQIDYIFEGKPGELWLCGGDKVIQIEYTNDQVAVNRKLTLENPDMEITVGVAWDEQVLFTNPEGFFTFSRANNKIVRVDTLPIPAQYFAHEGSILYRAEHGWNLAGRQAKRGNLQMLNLFQDLRFISSDQQPENLWVISQNNELYKFYGDKISPDEVVFPLFLKTVTNNDTKTGSPTQIHISEDKSAVRFEIVQPDYVSPEAVEFRYQLEGMSETWSPWSASNNLIYFPYLRPGEYTLLVQSKNIFGKIAELQPMKFEVLPPYWKRSWFYAMEFSLLATLVLLSFRLNNRYRFVSRLLTLLTIILLIEFIQTVIQSNIHFGEGSPVIDFITQVFIALLILPVEGYLRNLMFKSLDPSSKIYQIVTFKFAGASKAKLEEFETSDEERR